MGIRRTIALFGLGLGAVTWGTGCVGDADPAANITDTTATLAGHCTSLADPSSQSITYFEYGTTTSYGMKTPVKIWSAGLCASFADAIGNLAPNTLYHFRACGREFTQNTIPLCSGDRTFTTTAASPTVPALAWETLAAATKTQKATTAVSTLTVTGYSSGGVGRLLVAFVSWGGPTTGHNTITVAGGGLTWARVAQSIGQPGNAEIWTAYAAAGVTGATITATRNSGAYAGLLTVKAVRNSAGTGIGVASSGTTGPQSVGITTSGATSWLLAVGSDVDQAVARTMVSGQAKVTDNIVPGSGAFWSQRDASVPSGATSIGTTAPLGASRWNYAAVEVRPDTTAPSTCAFTNVAPDEELRGNKTITVSTSDNYAVTAVEILSDSYSPLVAATGAGSAWTAILGTTSLGDGPLTLVPECGDGAGNVMHGSPVRVWISNRRGALMGMNIWTHVLSNIDVVAATDVRWVRDGGWEWQWMGQTQAQYNQGIWSFLDGANPEAVSLQQVADRVHSRGMRLLVAAMGSPDWVSGRLASENLGHPVPLPVNAAYYAGYVKELCKRGADAVEIWNEPNLAFWNPSSTNPWHNVADWPRNYAKLLRAAYTAIKSDPLTSNCQIIAGAMAPYGHDQVDQQNPVPYLVNLYTAKENLSDSTATLTIAGYFDAISFHPYTPFPDAIGPKDWSHPWQPSPIDPLVSNNPVHSHGFEQTWQLHQIMTFLGDSHKIWSTEAGAATYTADGSYSYGAPCTAGCGTLETAAAPWAADYIDAWMSTGAVPGSNCGGTCSSEAPTNYFGSFTGPFIYFTMWDNSGAAGGNQERHFGLRHDDDTPKPGFNVFTATADQMRP